MEKQPKTKGKLSLSPYRAPATNLMRLRLHLILESPVLIAEISDGVQVSVQRLVFDQRRFHAIQPVQQRLDGILELAGKQQSFFQLPLAVHGLAANRVPSERGIGLELD